MFDAQEFHKKLGNLYKEYEMTDLGLCIQHTADFIGKVAGSNPETMLQMLGALTVCMSDGAKLTYEMRMKEQEPNQ